MCRLAVSSGLNQAYEYACAYAELELSQGGHGNGLFLAKDKKVHKGVGKSVVDLAKLAAGEKDFCLFHTRLASVGGIKDELCHPFEVKGEAGEFVVAHNGHWSSWQDYCRNDAKSDTESVADLVGHYGLGVLLSGPMAGSGVWITYDVQAKKMYAVKRSGEFWLQMLAKDKPNDPPAFFHASELLYTTKRYRTSDSSLHTNVIFELRLDGKAKERNWIKGVDLPRLRTTTTYGSYYGGYSSLGSKWLHDQAEGKDGKKWTCYCKKDSPVLCSQCEEHKKVYGELPVYTDEKKSSSRYDFYDPYIGEGSGWGSDYVWNCYAAGCNEPIERADDLFCEVHSQALADCLMAIEIDAEGTLQRMECELCGVIDDLWVFEGLPKICIECLDDYDYEGRRYHESRDSEIADPADPAELTQELSLNEIADLLLDEQQTSLSLVVNDTDAARAARLADENATICSLDKQMIN